MRITNKRIVIICGAVVVLVLSIIFLQKKEIDNYQNFNQIILEPDWQTYRNDDLGVEFKYPSRIFIQDGACKLIDGNYRTLYAPVETKVLAKDNVIYVGQAYSYDIDNKGCIKKDNDLTQDYIALKIIIKNNVLNSQNLNELVEEFYGGAGDQCHINEKREASQAGVYDIVVHSDGKSWDESRCFINSQTFMKYYPKKNKLMFTDLGMEYRFLANASGTVTFDQAMINSFKFLNN